MFTKSNLIATIVAALWAFIGGYLLWGVLTVSFFEAHSAEAFQNLMKEVPNFGILALGCLVQGFAFASIYRHYGASAYSALNGLGLGILLGILTGFGGGVIDYAVGDYFDAAGAWVNGFVYIVFFGVMGLLVGLVYKKNL